MSDAIISSRSSSISSSPQATRAFCRARSCSKTPASAHRLRAYTLPSPHKIKPRTFFTLSQCPRHELCILTAATLAILPPAARTRVITACCRHARCSSSAASACRTTECECRTRAAACSLTAAALRRAAAHASRRRPYALFGHTDDCRQGDGSSTRPRASASISSICFRRSCRTE